MAEFNDPDLQDELAAMSGSPKTSLFGGRMTSKYFEQNQTKESALKQHILCI